MKFSILATLLTASLTSQLALANEQPTGGGSNFAYFGCYESDIEQCWGAGENVDCGPVPAGNYYAGSVDPNGYLAGAYGSANYGPITGGCPAVYAGAHFTTTLTRTYDNWKTSQNVKVYVDVVNTNGYLTLNTHLADGGGCNLPVTKNQEGADYSGNSWEAAGDYAHHCW